jgi:hypothetical protein
MCCAPGLVFDGTEGVGSRFHVLDARTRFRRYRGRRVLFSCFAPRTGFRRYRGRRVPFSCFARPDSFSAITSALGPVFMFYAPELISVVPKASNPVFLFCAPGLHFSGVECVGSHFPVLRGQTRFRRYQGRRVPFSYFARPDSFSAVPRASGPVFLFCPPRLIFGCTEGVGSHFHVLRARSSFRW